MKTPTKTLEKPLHKVWADAVRASGVVCNKPTALFGLAWVERDGKLEDPIAVDSMKGIRTLFGSDPYIRSIWVLHQEQPEEPRLYTRYRFRVPARRYASRAVA